MQQPDYRRAENRARRRLVWAGNGESERDNTASTSLHDRYDRLGRAVRDGANGSCVKCQMPIPLGGASLAVPRVPCQRRKGCRRPNRAIEGEAESNIRRSKNEF